METRYRAILGRFARMHEGAAGTPRRPFAGCPYRELDREMRAPAAARVPVGGIEAMAWFVAFASSFVRLLFGVVRPELDREETILACLSLAVTLIAFELRSRL